MIVAVDFDGTICTGLNFVIEDKTPNKQLIEQINYLRSCGNYIKIVTARGAYNTTLEERTKKYYDTIKLYLDTNKIAYDEISFNKEFADIYIDDLAVRPDEVVITKDLSSVFTKNIVTRINDFVIKSGDTSGYEYLWYNAYQNKADIPEILNVTRHSIVYKYIVSRGPIDFDLLLDKIETYSHFPKLNSLEFDSYIANIRKHLVKNEYVTNGHKLLKKLSRISVPASFAHGDLSVLNIIPVNLGVKFIDPLYGPEKFGSYVVDYAKLLFSIKFYGLHPEAYELVKERAGVNYINILIAAEAVRVASYRRQFNFIAENLINEL